MAVFTFSTKDKQPADEQMIREVKAYCEKHCLNFSGVVVNKLREFKEEKVDGRQN